VGAVSFWRPFVTSPSRTHPQQDAFEFGRRRVFAGWSVSPHPAGAFRSFRSFLIARSSFVPTDSSTGFAALSSGWWPCGTVRRFPSGQRPEHAVQQGNGADVPYVGAERPADGVLGSVPVGRVASQVGPQLIADPLASGRDHFALGRRRDLVSGIGARYATLVGRYSSRRVSRAPLLNVGPAGAALRVGAEALRSPGLQAGSIASRGAGGSGSCGHCARRRAVVAFRFGHQAPASSGMAPPELVGRKRSASRVVLCTQVAGSTLPARALANKRMQLAARGLWSAGRAGRRPSELRAGVGGFASGRRTVYVGFTAGVS
jgi:hypothetical protein